VLGQLIAARLAIELVLAAVDLRRLPQDLARGLLIAEIGLRAAFAATFVPSIATTPTDTSPARRQRPSTPVNSSASASSWRTRNSAIVEWSGTRLEQITR
jgi:hypothetical protein